MNQTEQKYFLALQRRPGDSIFIDIARLPMSNGISTTQLAEIDIFTMQYTIEQIIKAIQDANIANPLYIEGQLIIQDNSRHTFKLIDKDYIGQFNIESFLKGYSSNKEIMNNIAYKFGTLINDIVISERFKTAAKEGNIALMLQMIFSISYITQRKLMIFLIDIYHKEEQKKQGLERVRDKAA